MTEAQWLVCEDPQAMWEQVWDSLAERKLLLFGVACCRRIWHLLVDARSREIVEAVEWMADGEITREDLEPFSDAAHEVFDELREGRMEREQAALAAIWLPANATEASHWVQEALVAERNPRRPEELESQIRKMMTDFIRDLLGPLPFQKASVSPSWSSNDASVSRLAKSIDEDNAFDRLPILADALEEAGCTDAAILEHCRGPGPHLRGCWVVDLLLGKK